MLSEGSRAGVCPNYKLKDYNTIKTFPLLYFTIIMNDATNTIASFLKLAVFFNSRDRPIVRFSFIAVFCGISNFTEGRERTGRTLKII